MPTRTRREAGSFGLERSVFVVTSAFGALVVSRERDHAAAAAVRSRPMAERWRLVTTTFVVAETHALPLPREGRTVAAEATRAILQSRTLVVRVEEIDERRGWSIVERYADKDLSRTDAISFAVMEWLRLRIGHAFTFDRPFAQHGFTVLSADDRP